MILDDVRWFLLFSACSERLKRSMARVRRGTTPQRWKPMELLPMCDPYAAEQFVDELFMNCAGQELAGAPSGYQAMQLWLERRRPVLKIYN